MNTETEPVAYMDFPRVELRFYTSIEALQKDWRTLEDASNCTPFQRLSWIKPLYDCIISAPANQANASQSPFLISGYQNKKLVFVFPMMIETNIFAKRLKWIGSNVSDYNGAIIDARLAKCLPRDFYGRVFSQVAKLIPDLDAIHLTRNPLIGPVAGVTNRSSEKCWHSEHSSHVLNLSNNWKSLYAQTRSKKSRQRLRGKYRALKNSHSISFKQIRNPEERLQASEQILDWKSGQLLERGSINPFGSSKRPSTTRSAVIASVQDDSTSSIRVFGMFQDNKLVAGILAFIEDEKFYYLVSAYCPKFPGKFSIGTQLLLKTLELASRSGLHQYDFLLGDEAYKFDWCDTNIPLVNSLTALTLKGKIYGIGVRSIHFLKKQIMRSQFLNNLAKQLIRASQIEALHQSDSISSRHPATKKDLDTEQARSTYSQLLTGFYSYKEKV